MIVRRTVAEEIYHTLRRQILSLHLQPGRELNIQALANHLDVSRSPVRDALMHLSRDHLVDIFPQRGTRVSRIDLKQVEEERFLRKSLEEAAASIFISKATESHLDAMNQAIERQISAMKATDHIRFIEADDAFHQVIFHGIDMDRIWSIVCDQSGNHHRIRLLSFSEQDVLENIIVQHRQMVSAIGARDTALLSELEHEHLSKLLEETKSMVAHHPDYFTKEMPQDDPFPTNHESGGTS